MPHQGGKPHKKKKPAAKKTGLTAAQSKLPPQLRKAIAAKKKRINT